MPNIPPAPQVVNPERVMTDPATEDSEQDGLKTKKVTKLTEQNENISETSE